MQVTRQQIGEKKAENYGFASFESVPYAHLVARKLQGKRKNGSHFDLAPQPKDIIWEVSLGFAREVVREADERTQNLTMLDGARTRSKFFGAILLIVVCFFYTIPLLAVSLLANLTALYFFFFLVYGKRELTQQYAGPPTSSSSKTGPTTTPSSCPPSSEDRKSVV